MVTFGSSGFICCDATNDMEVLKGPLWHDLSRCNEEIVIHITEEEAFSAACIDWGKMIYRLLPKHDNILDCLVIIETGIRLPYM
jgi:hypothetical protein